MKTRSVAYLLICVSIIGCGARLSPEEKRQRDVVVKLNEHMESLPRDAETLIYIEPLNGGYALVVKQRGAEEDSEKYAYWNREGVYYTVNEAAMKCSPDLSVAPKEITYERVCEVTGVQP